MEQRKANTAVQMLQPSHVYEIQNRENWKLHFPDGPVVETLPFCCRGQMFDPWFGNLSSQILIPQLHGIAKIL